MNKTKFLYEAPTAHTFVVRCGGMFCGSPGDYQANGTRQGNIVESSGFDGWDD